MWWVLEPAPWGVTSLLPLIILPVLGIMDLKGTAAIYGQSVLFLVLAVLLVGYSCKKHGLGQRFAVALLTIGWVKGSVTRFIFVYMVATFCLAAIVHSAAIAIVIPIGVATMDFIAKEYQKKGITSGTQKIGTMLALGALFATEAGYMVTPASTVHNAIAISLMEKLCGVTITYFQWTETGIIMGAVCLILGYSVLRLLFKPEVDVIPGGVEFFRERKKELGNMTYVEKMVMFVLAALVFLWILPTFVTIKWMDLYWVAILGLIAMFLIPADIEKGEGILTKKDFLNSNWNVIFLVATGVGMAGVLEQFGVVKYLAGQLGGVNGMGLLLISSFVTPIITNFVTGAAATTAMGTLVFPLINSVGINPAVIARICASMSTGLIFPWAGIAAAMVFSSGLVSMKDMIRTGAIVTVIYCIVVTLGSVIMVPLFHAYTIMK
jgi:Di- and tricarboxylate transporters